MLSTGWLWARWRRVGGAIGVVLSCGLPAGAAEAPLRPTIIVQDFINRSYEISHDWLGIGLAYLVRKDLATLGTLHLLEDRRVKQGESDPIADYVIDGEVRLDEVARGGDGKFVVFVTLDRLGAEAVRRQFLTEGAPSQLFDMAEYLTERIARHLGTALQPEDKLRFRAAMTQNLAAFQQFSEAMVERRIHVKIEAYERAILLDPEFAEAHFHLGRVNTVLRNYAAAERNLRRAIELSPKFADAHNDLGYVLAQEGRLDEARASYETAIAIDLQATRYRLNLGDLLRQAGNTVGATRAYESVLALVPGNAEAVAGLAATIGGTSAVSAVAALTTPSPASSPRPKPSTPTPRPLRPPLTATPSPGAVAPTPHPSASLIPTHIAAGPTPHPAASATPTHIAAGPTPHPAASVTPVAATIEPSAALSAPSVGAELEERDAKELQLAVNAAKRLRGDRDVATAALQAAQVAAAAVQRGPLYLALGRFYLSQNLNHAAVAALEVVALSREATPEAHATLAGAYARIGKHAAAERELAAASR